MVVENQIADNEYLRKLVLSDSRTDLWMERPSKHSMKRYILFAILIASFLLLLSGLWPQSPEQKPVTVVFTGSVHGYLEPCG